MTAVVDKARQGTRNRTAGLAWMQAGVRYLRTWWPSAERQLHAGRADIAGVGDLMVEMTTEPWAKLWVKLDQAERDMQSRWPANHTLQLMDDPAARVCGECETRCEPGGPCACCWDGVPSSGRRDWEVPFCVWKKHNRRDDGVGLGPVDPGEGAVIFRARVIFPLLARLEELERRELAAESGPVGQEGYPVGP
jgi:hypothetical protein